MKWRRVYTPGRKPLWAVRYDGQSRKDFPEWFQPCFERFQGGKYPLDFAGGELFSVKWVRKSPLYDTEPFRTKVEVGSYIFAHEDGGVSVLPSNEVKA